MPAGGVHFRVWAPKCKRVEVVLDPTRNPFAQGVELSAEPDGYFAGTVHGATRGTQYQFRLDGGERLFPDPASRFQPDGPHGPSQVIDPLMFDWTDGDWAGLPQVGQVIYELHVGTFTPAGTFAAAQRELPLLADLGITTIEIMPLADFPGRFGWGYDGVNLFAPTRLYGTPDDLRRFVDEAHRLNLGVILDVVYNHFGPDGNYLGEFSDDYCSRKHTSDWGGTPNFDGPGSAAVRELVVSNATYWLEEFHLDGLRLDATQQIFDDTRPDIMADIVCAAKALPRARPPWIVAENETQAVRLLDDAGSGGCGLSAMWNDDFHHAAIVALTGRSEAYYSGYSGAPQEMISAVRHGFLYQGQWYCWQENTRGTSSRGIARHRLVHFIENHDQVANSSTGQRLHQLTSPGRYRAMTTLLLLAPQTPMLFQGQEYGARQPFFYFADHRGELGRMVDKGRKEFMAQFPSVQGTLLPDPTNVNTFTRCRLDPADRRKAGPTWWMHSDLLSLRRDDEVFSAEGAEVEGAVLGAEAFVLRFFAGQNERLLLINFGRDLLLQDTTDPLLAAPGGSRWSLLWSSEQPRYGGTGSGGLRTDPFFLPGQCALVLRPLTLERPAPRGDDD